MKDSSQHFYFEVRKNLKKYKLPHMLDQYKMCGALISVGLTVIINMYGIKVAQPFCMWLCY